MAKRTKAEIEALFRKTAHDVLKKDLSSVAPETKFAAMQVASVDVMEIIGAMEDELGVELPDSALARVESVQDLVQLFDDQQN